MKNLARIPSQLLSKEQSSDLKLNEQPYIILIPKSLLQKQGIVSTDISFDLFIDSDKKLSLVESRSDK